jgi:DeoR family transcriptional regulator, fructose operon transcriptional repressor
LRTSSDKKAEILNRVRERGACRVAELAEELGCTEMTVRRHLDRLEGEGLVERTHGGASATRRVRLEFSLYQRAQAQRSEKAAIGRAAAECVSATASGSSSTPAPPRWPWPASSADGI